ncbi:hypothetical protein O181_040116 [Austropuccinia psidii MF-1]|uniref:Uncharacterized protein n=1 Tax=Austropuccinia psidii MF-1 TaxID=1389203 RepID=A0A9Q3DAT6_9BASI|nr:hypothetical protein [Austropuccinia psidii MF-1]
MIPAPNEPNPITIHNILIPLVNDLIKLKSGIKICTPKSPNGHNAVFKLGCLIGDLVATRKVAGFTSHSADMFCNWCECTKSEIGNLKAGCIVQDYSNAFKDAKIWAEADCIAKKSGICWSELNWLLDPVKYTSLEGSNASKKESNRIPPNEDQMEIDSESQKILGLSTDQVTKLKTLFKEVVVPSGITRVPKDIGTAKEGKLKAAEWQLLFSIHLPLVVLNVFLEDVELYESNSFAN